MIIPKFEKRKIEYYKINKIHTILINDKNINNSYFAIKVNVGSLHESNKYNGLAHLLEHMIFMGSHNYPDSSYVMNYIQQNGGSTNAYTASLETVYYFTIPTIYFKKAIDIFSSAINNPLIEEEMIRKEINAVNNEHLKNLDKDFWRIRQTIFDIFKIKKFYTGNKETLDVKGIREALMDFYKKYYINSNFNICIISNLNIDRQKELVNEYFNKSNKLINIPNIPKKLTDKPKNNYQITPINTIHQIIYCYDNINNIDNIYDLITYNLGSKNKFSLYNYINNQDENLLKDITGILLDEGIYLVLFDLNYLDEKVINLINNAINSYFNYIKNLSHTNFNNNLDKIRKVRKFIFNNNIINNFESLGDIFISNLGKYDKNNLYVGNYLFNINNINNINNIYKKPTIIIVNKEKIKNVDYSDKYIEYFYNTEYYQYKYKYQKFNNNNNNDFFKLTVNLKEPKILKLDNKIINENNIWYLGIDSNNEPIYVINILYNIDNEIDGLLLVNIYNDFLEEELIDYINLGNNYYFSYDKDLHKIIFSIKNYNSYQELDKILDLLSNFDPNKLLEKNKNILIKSINNMNNLNSWEYLENNYYFPHLDEILKKLNKINKLNNINFYNYHKIVYGGNINKLNFNNFTNKKIKVNNDIKLTNLEIKLDKQPCIEVLYNSNKFNPINLLSLEILTNLFSSEFFDLFRTQKQLGYLVRMNYKEIYNNYYLSQKIQTDYDLNKLEKEIDLFNKNLINELEIIDNKEIEKNKKIIKLNLKNRITNNNSILSKYNSFRNTIVKDEYMFDKDIILLKKLKNITKNSLIDFLKNILKNKIVRKIIN